MEDRLHSGIDSTLDTADKREESINGMKVSDWLSSDSLAFPIDAESVRIILSPADFYKTLLDRISSARERICLSSLYIGDGRLERHLVDSLSARLSSESDDAPRVTVLIDYLRGTRGAGAERSSTTLLRAIADRANVFLYHTPELSGFFKSVLPERSNEIVGLQHMKLYIFDDSVLISGANLSDTYFTNRQDRYVLFENCPELANFFCAIVDAVSEKSFRLNSDGTTSLADASSHHPFQGNAKAYTRELRARLLEVVEEARKRRAEMSNQEEKGKECDTVVYPLLQMGPLGIHDEFDMLRKMLSSQDKKMEMTLASGYFNCIDDYDEAILGRGQYSLDIIMAAPDANGFAGASGASRFVPAMYSWVAARFLKEMQRRGRDRVQLLEYSRPDWSFHAKGIWSTDGERMATVIGSSNYGYRSVHRDLEAQVVVETSNDRLMARLNEERNALLNFTSLVDAAVLRRSDHHVPRLVAFISRFIRNFF